MRINANQITALRIVLLPLPLFLIYGDTSSRLWALLIFTFLGLTDYLDGLMARRHGVTALGRLLDPIADKIFMAVTLIPLADLEILPMWIVWPIFLREFLITEMRRFMTPGGNQLKVTELAKIKTTVQMTGLGLILLTDTFPDKLITISFLSGLLLATAFLAIAVYSKGGGLSARFKAALALESAALATILILPARSAILAYGIIMLAITLVSGAQYFAACFPAVLKRGWKGIADLALSLFMPLFVLSLLPVSPKESHLLIVLILAIEFGVQGIDMWAVQEGRKDLSKWKKKFLVPWLSGALILCIVGGMKLEDAIRIFLILTSLSSLGYLFVDVWTHKRLFKKGEFF